MLPPDIHATLACFLGLAYKGAIREREAKLRP